MSDVKLKFTIPHLLALVTVVSVVCALTQYSVLAAMFACPFTVGPTIAHAFLPTRSALFAGALSSIYWTFLVTLPVYPLTHLVFVGFDARLELTPWLISIPLFSSIMGGYLGARVAAN